MPRTRHPLGGPGQASRPFIARDEFIAAFDAARRGIARDRTHVMAYHGVGGIGKTALLQELRRRLREDAPYVAHAGLDLRDADARLPASALVRLRAVLHNKYKVPFPTFDIAFATYWKLANPHLPLAKSELSFLQEGEIAGEVVSIVEDIPGLGLISKIPAVLDRLGRSAKDWWTRRGQAELRSIATPDDPNAVEDWLPTFWAADVRAWLADEPNRRAVVFLDSFEALWEGRGKGERGSRPDEWIREWAGHLQGVLVVVAGREILRWTDEDASWEGLIDQRLVGGLSAEDADRFLRDSEVAEPEVRAVIVERSRGVPFYLDLAVDTYERIRAGEEQTPRPDEFDGNLGALLGRFLRYLTIEQRAALYTLSVPETFDMERFGDLMREFSTGYPATAVGLDELRRFSFVEEPEPGRYALHALMREALAAKHDPAERGRVHAHLFERARAALEEVDPRAITDSQQRALHEATIHGQVALEANLFLRWYWRAEEPFYRAAEWRLLQPLRESVLELAEQTLGPEHPYTLTSVNNLAVLLQERKRLDEAESLYQRVLEVRERTLGPEHPRTLTSMNNLADLLQEREQPDEAEPLYQRVLEARERVLGPEHADTLISVNNLAYLFQEEGRPSEAESLYRRALHGFERVLGPEHPDTLIAVNNLADLLQERGRLVEAEPLYRRALEARERVLGSEHPDTLISANDLADLLQARGRLDEAELLFHRAHQGFERVLGTWHPSTAIVRGNLTALQREIAAQRAAAPSSRQAREESKDP